MNTTYQCADKQITSVGALAPWQPRHNGDVSSERLSEVVGAFLDTASTSFGRATHYNTREEQQRAELQTHEALLRMDRDLYTILLLLPGVTDRARQIGTKNLLAVPRNGGSWVMDARAEREVLNRLVRELPPPRIFKLFDTLRVGIPDQGIHRANNARTRKLILRTILGSSKLELWSVKYRRRMAAALTHAWGVRLSSAIRSILAKSDETWTAKERAILRRHIERNVEGNASRAYACVGFALGNRNRLTLPLHRAFQEAKSDLSRGKKLPLEVLEGIRSVYHKDAAHGDVLRIAAASLTRDQKLLVQKRAEKADVEVSFDPTSYDPVRLYLYAFERGMSAEIAQALLSKAQRTAERFPVRYEKLGILVDASRSMSGGATQKLRPIATVLSLRDVLQHIGHAHVVYAGGEISPSGVATNGSVGGAAPSLAPALPVLVSPSGHTSLAEGLLELLADSPEAVFVLSDGYENRPAGRFAEVVSALRSIDINTPILHLNPVFAAEAQGVRTLRSPEAATLSVRSPDGFALAFLRGLLQSDPVRAIQALIQTALPALQGGAS